MQSITRMPAGIALEEAYLLVGVALVSLFFGLNYGVVQIQPVTEHGWRWELYWCIATIDPTNLSPEDLRQVVLQDVTKLYVGDELSVQRCNIVERPCAHSRYFRYLADIIYTEDHIAPDDREPLKLEARKIAREIVADRLFTANADAVVTALLAEESLTESRILEICKDDDTRDYWIERHPLIELAHTSL